MKNNGSQFLELAAAQLNEDDDTRDFERTIDHIQSHQLRHKDARK